MFKITNWPSFAASIHQRYNRIKNFRINFLKYDKIKVTVNITITQLTHPKSCVLEIPFFPANQNFLKSFQKALIGWKITGPPKKRLVV